MNDKLPREFYTRPHVLTVARELLGKLLVVPAKNGRRVSGIIVEAEAYRGPQDRAAHSYGGRRTKRTETMYGLGGTAQRLPHHRGLMVPGPPPQKMDTADADAYLGMVAEVDQAVR